MGDDRSGRSEGSGQKLSEFWAKVPKPVHKSAHTDAQRQTLRRPGVAKGMPVMGQDEARGCRLYVKTAAEDSGQVVARLWQAIALSWCPGLA